MGDSLPNSDIQIAAVTVFKGLGGGFTYCENLISRLVNSDKLVNATFVLPVNDFLPYLNSPKVFRLPINYGTSVNRRLSSWIRGYFLRPNSKKVGTSKIIFYPLTTRMPRPSSNNFVVTTVHDLQHHDYPELFSIPQRIFRKYFYDFAIKKSDHIITISNFSAKRIIEVLEIAPSKISVIPLGVEELFFQPPDVDSEFIEKLGQYIYYPANITKHKNHQALLKAFEIVRISNPKLNLVLSGGGSELLNELPQNVIHVGHVSKEQLSDLYHGAKTLVFPSLYEGFGLPVLEALASGTPVVCSNLESLQEICGDLAMYFNPSDHNEIAMKINESLLLQNNEAINKGKILASNFTWDLVAEGYVKVLNDLASNL